MHMYFVVGIWLLGLMATVLSIVFERRGESEKMVYSLGVPGVISIGSFWAWLIVISLRLFALGCNDGAITAIFFSILGTIVIPVLLDWVASQLRTLGSKFLWIMNLTYFVTIIVGVCFVYPTIMYFK